MVEAIWFTVIFAVIALVCLFGVIMVGWVLWDFQPRRLPSTAFDMTEAVFKVSISLAFAAGFLFTTAGAMLWPWMWMVNAWSLV